MAKAGAFGNSLQALAAEIERRAESKRDFIAPVPKFAMAVANDKPVLEVVNGEVKQFEATDIAHSQLADYVGIPAQYYNRLAVNDPGLLASNVNRWLRDKPTDRRLIRTLDGRARAFLSDKYRTLENEDLAEAVLPVLLDMNLMPLSCEITERRLYLKFVDRSIERDVPTGRAMGDGSHVFFDTVSPVITLSNSEVGMGALSIETGVFTKVCTNLAMVGTSMRKYHTGSRAQLSDDVFALLTDETKKATDRAVWLQVRDLVKSAFDAAKFEAMCLKLGGASKDRIDPDKVTDVVERVGRKFSFNEGERKGILGRLIEGADLTRYGVHAAITRFSQDDSVGYDRATEMERIGGEVIDLTPRDWSAITESRALVAA